MDAIKLQIRDLSQSADNACRKRIITELRDLSIDLEDSDDTLQRLSNTPLQLYGAWIGSRLKVFDILSSSDKSVSLQVLAQETEADYVLLGRLLRYMASIKLIDEDVQDSFSGNNVTRTLASPQGQNSLDLHYNIVNPVFCELPKFLQKTAYQNPSDETKTAFQDAFNFNGPIYAWWASNPDKAAVFNKHMEYKRDSGASWLDVFPIHQHVPLLGIDEVLFVDVGGNVGHQCARLKAVHPDLTGRVILQDLPFAIENALDTPGVENMVHNFFEPQPVKGARIYYLRGVLHCFQDDKCIQILRNMATVMARDSIILIDEASLPNTNVFWQATQMDLLMMSSLASMERTRSQWENVLASAGLKILDVFVYNPKLYESVIMVVLV